MPLAESQQPSGSPAGGSRPCDRGACLAASPGFPADEAASICWEHRRRSRCGVPPRVGAGPLWLPHAYGSLRIAAMMEQSLAKVGSPAAKAGSVQGSLRRFALSSRRRRCGNGGSGWWVADPRFPPSWCALKRAGSHPGEGNNIPGPDPGNAGALLGLPCLNQRATPCATRHFSQASLCRRCHSRSAR